MASRPKLTGRAFYESIGSPRVVLAPMVDQSEFAWRLLTRSFAATCEERDDGTLLAYTPMLHSRLYRQDPKYRRKMFEPTRKASTLVPVSDMKNQKEQDSFEGGSGDDKLFLDGHPSLDRPLTVQFCSNDPEDFLEAARRVAPYCDAVDLNLGCPQGIARKGHYGAFLQEDWHLIHSLISNLHHNLEVPITAKMRILETKERTLEYARMILSAGASILTVHGRRREQKGHTTGVADWTVLRYLRDNLPPETVLFANGNILQHEDIEKCLDVTGFDAVMGAEGNLCDPSVFFPPPAVGTETRDYWRGRDGKGGYRMDAVVRRYLDIVYRHVLELEPPQRRPLFSVGDGDANGSVSRATEPASVDNHYTRTEPGCSIGEPPAKKQKRDDIPSRRPKIQSPNLLAMRPHLFSLLRPLIAKHTHVRDALAKAQTGDMSSFERVLQLIESVTADALVEYDKGNIDVTKHAEKAKKSGAPKESYATVDDEHTSMAAVQRCWRPWWICQPYVRPLPAEAIAKGSITLGKKTRQQLRNDEGLARDVGLPPGGSTTTVNRTEPPSEQVEIPKEGLVCG